MTDTASSRHPLARPARSWPRLLALAVMAGVVCLPALAASGEGPRSAEPSAITAQSRLVSVDGGGRYTDVSAAGLAGMLARKDFPLINVHVPYEGEIAGTDLFLPFDQVGRNLGRLPADKSAKLVLYCRSGHMSAIAARTLVGLGYTNVWNLEGGMIAWEDAGHPVVHKKR